MTLTQDDLNQFTGTAQYYKHWSKLLYTDGVQYLAEEGGAYWLIDAIASYQPTALKDPMLKDIQFWKLKAEAHRGAVLLGESSPSKLAWSTPPVDFLVNPNGSAVLTCERDTDDVAITQEIPLTDFPLSGVKLYLTTGVLLLPSEY